MNLARRSSVAALILAATLAGCSSSRELNTQGQAAGFTVEVAGGQPASDWRLAAKPSPEAAEAWADRGQIADLGERLRRQGAAWACEFAHKAVGLGSIGYYDENDARIQAAEGTSERIGTKLVSKTLIDMITMRFRELVLVTTSICGPYKS